jgi:molybdopterin-binding protein
VTSAASKFTPVITADAVRELRLEKGLVAAALIQSTEVMILRVLRFSLAEIPAPPRR